MTAPRLPIPRREQPITATARALTNTAFDSAAARDFYRAAVAIDQALDEARATGYEAGLAAARREVNA